MPSLISHVLFLADLASWFEGQLKLIQPNIVILESWYGDCQMALTMAAKRLGIPVVDVQHAGVAGNGSHLAYTDWTNIPEQGYEVMPNYFWVYNQKACDSIRRWGRDREKPILGGRPMDLVWSDAEHGNLAQYFQRHYSRLFGDNRPAILFTLQWGMEYPKWLIDFINADMQYMWLIRFHPVVDAGQRDFQSRIVLKNNVFRKEVDYFPLEILLKNVDVHLTMYSSVIMDAASWGCHSIAMHPMAREHFAAQIEDNILLYADCSKGLSVAIAEIVRQKAAKRGKKASFNLYYQGQQGLRDLIAIIENEKTNRRGIM